MRGTCRRYPPLGSATECVETLLRTLSAAKLISASENEFMQLELFQLIKQTESIKTDEGFDFRETRMLSAPFHKINDFIFTFF